MTCTRRTFCQRIVARHGRPSRAIADLQSAIVKACRASSRPRRPLLIAVSRTTGGGGRRRPLRAGQCDFGETCPGAARHLSCRPARRRGTALAHVSDRQRSKVHLVVRTRPALIHSVDAYQTYRGARGPRRQTCGVRDEPGFRQDCRSRSAWPAKAEAAVIGGAAGAAQNAFATTAALAAAAYVPCRPAVTTPEVRPYFRRLRELRDTMPTSRPGVELSELSIGDEPGLRGRAM